MKKRGVLAVTHGPFDGLREWAYLAMGKIPVAMFFVVPRPIFTAVRNCAGKGRHWIVPSGMCGAGDQSRKGRN
jgi:hypothetical protein